MASTSNNSGLAGNVDELGPDEKWDDETDEQFRVRMTKKEATKKQEEEIRRTAMPPCIG